MSKAKNIRRKTKTARATKASTRKPKRVENPGWLAAEPSGPGPNPPVITRPASLPFLELSWENFERLCYRVAQKAGEVEKVWAYGTQGHEQLGIDVLVRMKDGTFETWQSKRHKTFGSSQLKAAVKHFLDGAWAGQAKKFILAVACEATNPKVVDAIEKARSDLKNSWDRVRAYVRQRARRKTQDGSRDHRRLVRTAMGGAGLLA